MLTHTCKCFTSRLLVVSVDESMKAFCYLFIYTCKVLFYLKNLLEVHQSDLVCIVLSRVVSRESGSGKQFEKQCTSKILGSGKRGEPGIVSEARREANRKQHRNQTGISGKTNMKAT